MNAVVWGAGGKMGAAVRQALEVRGDRMLAGVDRASDPAERIFADPAAIPDGADVVIDFSRPDALGNVLSFCLARGCPAVLAVTGYDDEALTAIRSASRSVPLLLEANLSIGVAVLSSLVTRAARALGARFDIEIVEAHHAQKADSPSGTALLLAEAANRGRDEALRVVCGRAGMHTRAPDEIGIHAVRGGTIVGTHTVLFAGPDETLALSHTALSRLVFADGAVTAAHALLGRPPALYRLRDLLPPLDRG